MDEKIVETISISIHETDYKILKDEAKKRGVSHSELIRSCFYDYLESQNKKTRNN